jgi:hypothetical protein
VPALPLNVMSGHYYFKRTKKVRHEAIAYAASLYIPTTCYHAVFHHPSFSGFRPDNHIRFLTEAKASS